MPSHNCGERKTRCQRYTTDMPLCQWWQQCSLTQNHDYYASIKEYVVDQLTRSWHIHSSVPSSFLLTVSGLIFNPSLLHNFLLFKIIYSNFICMYISMSHVYWVLAESRRKASDPLELEIQAVVSCLALGPGMELWSSEIPASACKH